MTVRFLKEKENFIVNSNERNQYLRKRFHKNSLAIYMKILRKKSGRNIIKGTLK